MNEAPSFQQTLDRVLTEIQFIKELLLQQSSSTHEDKPLTVAEAAEFVGLSTGTIYQLVHKRKLQPLQRMKRGRLLFYKQTLIDFLHSKK